MYKNIQNSTDCRSYQDSHHLYQAKMVEAYTMKAIKIKYLLYIIIPNKENNLKVEP